MFDSWLPVAYNPCFFVWHSSWNNNRLSNYDEMEARLSTQDRIEEVTSGMCELLKEKNKRYGDSALNPKNVFFKGDATNSIRIRLDDKIGRVMNSNEIRVNDICDLIGYEVLLLISMGVTKEDILALID